MGSFPADFDKYIKLNRNCRLFYSDKHPHSHICTIETKCTGNQFVRIDDVTDEWITSILTEPRWYSAERFGEFLDHMQSICRDITEDIVQKPINTAFDKRILPMWSVAALGYLESKDRTVQQWKRIYAISQALCMMYFGKLLNS